MDIPVFPIASSKGDPRQHQQHEPLHCHEERLCLLPTSVIAFSRVLDEDDYAGNCEGHITT
jgi:hypothetical protein